MDEALRKELFQCSLDSPGGWLMNAIWLKRASERIDFYEHYGEDLNSSQCELGFMLPVFNLLVGLSFENLLKGIIVAQRGSAGSSGKVDSDLTIHNMNSLVASIDRSVVPISAKEVAILINLEKYVIWAGRYPLPKGEKDLFVRSDSSQEHDLMASFWNRLYKHLRSVGWIKGMGGHELWTDKSRNRTEP